MSLSLKPERPREVSTDATQADWTSLKVPQRDFASCRQNLAQEMIARFSIDNLLSVQTRADRAVSRGMNLNLRAPPAVQCRRTCGDSRAAATVNVSAMLSMREIESRSQGRQVPTPRASAGCPD